MVAAAVVFVRTTKNGPVAAVTEYVVVQLPPSKSDAPAIAACGLVVLLNSLNVMVDVPAPVCRNTYHVSAAGGSEAAHTCEL